MAEGADPDALALRLGRHFQEALGWVAMDRFSEPHSAHAEFFGQVRRAGRELLNTMALPEAPSALAGWSQDQLAHAASIMRLERCGANPAALSETERATLALPSLEVRVPGKLTFSRAPSTRAASGARVPSEPLGYRELLHLAPYAVAALVALADVGFQRHAGRASNTGPPADSFREVLFNLLAWFHLDIFGRLPEAERGEWGARSGRSVEWAEEVLLLAEQKIPPVLRLACGPRDAAWRALVLQQIALTEAAELKAATVAGWLKKGCSFARRNMQHKVKR